MMKDILFASDLDNTLLFSRGHREPADVCGELLNGEPQGYFTNNAEDLLAAVSERMLFVPVTSRSIEQYLRIRFPDGLAPRYAVTTNGAILLVDGQADPDWREESASAAAPWREELQMAYELLGAVPQARRFRFVDDMYVFAACDDGKEAGECGAYFADRTSLDVAVSGRKVYFFPPPINKGAAVQRLKARFKASKVVCAGDSPIDVPMLRIADVSIIPSGELLRGVPCRRKRVCDGTCRFYDYVLKTALEFALGDA